MIHIRRATLLDVPWIRKLAVASVVHTIPSSRSVAIEEVAEKAALGLKNLELMVHRRKQVAILVAVDTDRDQSPVGYLILEFNQQSDATGESQSFVVDIAVEPVYWGRRVGHKLVQQAARLSSEQGYRHMAAMVTASNRRALLMGLSMGFEIERYALVMGCGPDGPVRPPGRAANEQAHIVSRSWRQAAGEASPRVSGGQPVESTP